MAAVLSGSAVNIVFDYIFIFPMKLGLTGGAAATVAGNILTVFVLLTHLRIPGNGLHFSLRTARLCEAGEILTAGAPSFLIEAATGLITFTFNRQILRYLGHLGVVAYGVVANYALVMQSLFNGTGQAAQPIAGRKFRRGAAGTRICRAAHGPHDCSDLRRVGRWVRGLLSGGDDCVVR